MFGKYLQPLERTDIILTAIEAMTDASISDKEGASSMLDEAMKDPNSWLTDVSGLWLDCPAHEPFQGLFFLPSLPPILPSSLPPPSIPPSQAEASREGWEGQWFQWQQLGKWLRSSGSTILTCVPSRCQRS